MPKDESKPLKLWKASIELERYDTGARQRRTVRSKDPDECQRKLNVALAEEAARIRRPLRPVLPPVPTLAPSGSTGEWMRYWFARIAKSEVAPKTAETYSSMIRFHIIPALGDVPLLDLTPTHVRDMNTAVRSKGRSGATALQAHRVLSSALTRATYEGYVHRNVALLAKPPRKARPKLQSLTTDHARRIIRSATNDRLGSRWAAAVLTGARQGELLGLELDRVSDTLDLSWQLQRLTWSHGCTPFCGWRRGAECPQRYVDAPADHERRELTGGLWLTRPKSDAGWRMLPLVEPLRSLIEARVEAAASEDNPHGLLWTAQAGRRTQDFAGRPIDPRADNEAWHRLLRTLDIPDVRLHDARHAAIDLLYEAGASEIVIKDLVGHAQVDMTRRYRSGRSLTPMTSALEAVARLLGDSEGTG